MTAPGPGRGTSYWWAIGLAGAVVLGGILRLAWVMDMEYKGDEAWTFDRTQQLSRTDPFPWVGMRLHVGVHSPGLTLWIFLAISKIAGGRDPAALARAVQLLNTAAIALLVLFAWRCIDAEEREPWLWAAALVSVNPIAVLFHRKIWSPSVIPIFTLMMLMSWWYRHRRWGALGWGLAGAVLGQVQASGFFFAGGFLAWAMLFDRKRVAWPSWLVGSCLGTLPLAPWFRYLWAEFPHRQAATFKWTRLLEFKFWTRWVTEPLGLGLEGSLGPHFRDFLAYPMAGGRPTYLVLVLHAVVIGAGVLIFAGAAHRLWLARPQWRSLCIGRESPTAFTESAALWGYGILLSASGLAFQRHYMIVTFPLMFVWLARAALARPATRLTSAAGARLLLLTLCIGQALLSASLLEYIHVNGGAPRGDYGVAYGAQRSPIHPPLDY
jgi:hypothetical protein